MSEQAPPWPKQGPSSYFPSIEQKYGRSIAEWQQVIADCGLEKHMTIVVSSSPSMAWGTGMPTHSSAGRWQVTSPGLYAALARPGARGADAQPGYRLAGAAAVRVVPLPWVAPMPATKRVIG
jgi:Domain of unknown function (DUF4287)